MYCLIGRKAVIQPLGTQDALVCSDYALGRHLIKDFMDITAGHSLYTYIVGYIHDYN